MIVNKTPHKIVLVTPKGHFEFFPVEPAARVTSKTVPVGEIDGNAFSKIVQAGDSNGYYPLVKETFGEVEDLPAQEPGTWYIVSSMVQAALPTRDDLLSPSSDAIRHDRGHIVAVRSFKVNY